MRNTIIALTVLFLLTGCSSQAASAPPSAAPSAAEDLFPESDDFFANAELNPSGAEAELPEQESVKPEPAVTAPVQDPDPTALPSPTPEPETPKENTRTDVTPDDFAMIRGILSSGIPQDAEYRTMKYAVGEWKYCMEITFPDDGGIYQEYGFADLSLDYDRQEVVILPHPRLGGDAYELYPMKDSDAGYMPFSGGRDESGAVKLIGNDAVIYLIRYFTYSGTDFIEAEIWLSEETSGQFLMTKPQG